MNKKFWVSLFFNILETIIIYMIGLIFKVGHNEIIVIMITFFFTRLLCGKPKHFATWYRCFVWSLLVSTSLFALTDLHIFVILLLSAFTGYLSTGKADINDMYMWKGRSSNYQDIDDYIKYNPMSDELLDFEKKLKERDNLLYLLYKYRFKENLTHAQIAEKTDLETPRVSEKIDKVAFSLRIYCGI
jgi:hypothetical protein